MQVLLTKNLQNLYVLHCVLQRGVTMSTTMSVKIPEDLRKKMRKLNDQVEWSKEIREYIMRRIREIESKTRLDEAHKLIESTSGVPEGTAVQTVREDRESH